MKLSVKRVNWGQVTDEWGVRQLNKPTARGHHPQDREWPPPPKQDYCCNNTHKDNILLYYKISKMMNGFLKITAVSTIIQ